MRGEWERIDRGDWKRSDLYRPAAEPQSAKRERGIKRKLVQELLQR